MRVVHLALGCISGSPLRIVNALNKHTYCRATLITANQTIEKKRYFDIGLNWNSHREEAIKQIQQADIVHIHDAHAIDTLGAWEAIKRGTPIVFHHHVSGDYKAKSPRLGEVIHDIAILQYPERYVPHGRLLPNIVANDVPVSQLDERTVSIFYSPTFIHSSWHVPSNLERWNTKGREETLAMLARIRERSKLGNKRNRVALNVVQNLSFEACMRIKRASDIVLDDTVTGSYHLVGLESLAMGIPTIAYIDARMERLLKDLTGAPDIPWVNVRIEELEKTVAALIADPDLRRAIGKASHAWMQTYYREEVLIQHFVKAYEDLLANPQSFSRKRFNPDEKKAYWFVRGAYDVHYESRKHRIQRGSCPLGEASYMDHRGGDLHCSPFKSQVWIAEKRYPFGSWLFENRYRRIDARCKLFHEMRRKVLLEKYKQALPYAEGARVVDLASGTGYGTAFLKQEGRARSVVGVENDVLAVAYAQELYAVHGVCYLEKDVLHSSLQASSFDLVVAIDLIEWVDCDASLMRECVRLLAPGGRCVISAGDFWNKESEGFYKRRYTPQGFANLLSDGFQSVCLYRQLGPESRSPGVFIPENNTYAVLKEGESLIAVCSL